MLKRFKKIRKTLLKFKKKIGYKFNILVLITAFSCSLIFPQHSLAHGFEEHNEDLEIKIQGIVVKDALSPLLNPHFNTLSLEQNHLPEIKDRKLKVFNYRYITAYNVGVIAQTDKTPCVGASGHDLCDLVEQGVNICAANFVQLGTQLEIEGHGKCTVLDRMHSRFKYRVDIAMGPNEIAKAKEFGIKRLKVEIY